MIIPSSKGSLVTFFTKTKKRSAVNGKVIKLKNKSYIDCGEREIIKVFLIYYKSKEALLQMWKDWM